MRSSGSMLSMFWMARPFDWRVPSSDFVDTQPVAASFGGEEQHRVVHRGMIDVLDEVLIACGSAFGSDSAASLRAESASGVRLM